MGVAVDGASIWVANPNSSPESKISVYPEPQSDTLIDSRDITILATCGDVCTCGLEPPITAM